LKSVSLFDGIDAAELELLLACVGPVIKRAAKGDILLLAGEKPDFVGIALAGQLHIICEDYDGNRSLLAAVGPGDIFAEALCCAGVAQSPVSIIANAGSTVMQLGFARILGTCGRACAFHTKLIANMLGLIARKNLMLQSRMEIVGMKSVRARVTRYLESLAPGRGKEFAIPFNRGELADFLCVERSALSHELARMKKDGLLEYRKNIFALN